VESRELWFSHSILVLLRYSLFFLAHSSFVAKNYPTLKKLNPSFPILIREASNAEPMLFARYGMRQSRICVTFISCMASF
jgi:hypothetical protein